LCEYVLMINVSVKEKLIFEMDKYATYKVRDFVQDDDFIRWVKYPDLDQDSFWNQVIIKYPRQNSNINKAVILVKMLAREAPEVNDAEVDHVREKILRGMNRKKPLKLKLIARYLSVAAFVAMALGLGWSFFRMAPTTQTDSGQSALTEIFPEQHFSNSSDVPMMVTLPDTSKITLSPGSKIYYSYQKNDKREVKLDGEAYFSVTPDPDKPFFVYSGGLVTRVLGTTFTVSAFSDVAEVKVSVNSGRVEVYPAAQSENAGQSRLTLKPNQQAVFKKEDLSLTRILVEEPRVVISEEALKAYSYTDAPLSEIFQGLEEVYGIQVIYDEEKFKDCRVNMSLTTETLFEKLELIGKIVEARYNVVDGQVIVIGEGCR